MNTNFDNIMEPMYDFAKVVLKYSPGQVMNMVDAVDVDFLVADMALNGVTEEEMKHVVKLYEDYSKKRGDFA